MTEKLRLLVVTNDPEGSAVDVDFRAARSSRQQRRG